MDHSPNLTLPYLMAAQAQKHVTHNDAIRTLDALVQLSVIDRDLASPPAQPVNGDRYIVATSAAGDWSGHDGLIAAWQDNAWAFHSPQNGWLCWVQDEGLLLAFDGTNWSAAGGGSVTINPAALVGVNTTADATNKLAVKSDATLFSHDDVTPGTGDMRQKLNKAAAGNTVSQLYQTGYSGRAETGLTGDDDFRIKVSPDGTTWHEAIVIDRSTGGVTMPNTSGGGGGSGDVATDIIWDAKGDLAVGTGANTAARLAVGANGAPLVAASGEATGLKYAGKAEMQGFLGLDTATSANAVCVYTDTTGGQKNSPVFFLETASYTAELVKNVAAANVRMAIINYDNTNPNSSAGILLQTGGASSGDPYVNLRIAGGANWTFGLDNSDNDKFKVSNASIFGSGGDFFTITADGFFGFKTESPVQVMDINDDSLRVRTAKTPSSASDTGTQGQIAWDANYIYVCTATNTWKRAAIATW